MFKLLFSTLFLQFLFLTCLSQSKIKYDKYALINGGFCVYFLHIFKDSTFSAITGCESHGHYLFFGNWTQKKDTLTFYPVDNKNFKIIKNVSSTETADSILKVKIFDRQNNNITDKLTVGQLVHGKGIYSMSFDTIQNQRTDFKRDSSFIVLKSLERLLGQKLEIPTGGSNNFEITLNILGDYLFDNYSDWGAGSDHFVLIKRGDKLLSIDTYRNDKGDLVRDEFVKEKE
jgi:hypothetical protein